MSVEQLQPIFWGNQAKITVASKMTDWKKVRLS